MHSLCILTRTYMLTRYCDSDLGLSKTVFATLTQGLHRFPGSAQTRDMIVLEFWTVGSNECGFCRHTLQQHSPPRSSLLRQRNV